MIESFQMPSWILNTPVALIIFNRPDTTALVFQEIAKARPPKLLIIGDGAREDKPDEIEKCAQARAIIEQVNWDCEVLTNYSDVNLGCRHRISSGIDWIFEHVNEAIILEDDCLPDQTFFRFCEEMLERYQEDERIGMIAGSNFLFGKKHGTASYYYSSSVSIWGWATWKRAWRHYDRDMKKWPQVQKKGWLKSLLLNRREHKHWSKHFQRTYDGQIDTWAYQWVFANWLQGWKSVVPNRNLISNIGFGDGATHTKDNSVYSNIKIEPLEFPLDLPESIPDRYEIDRESVIVRLRKLRLRLFR